MPRVINAGGERPRRADPRPGTPTGSARSTAPGLARHPDAGHDPCFVSVREDRDPGAHDSSATSGRGRSASGARGSAPSPRTPGPGSSPSRDRSRPHRPDQPRPEATPRRGRRGSGRCRGVDRLHGRNAPPRSRAREVLGGRRPRDTPTPRIARGGPGARGSGGRTPAAGPRPTTARRREQVVDPDGLVEPLGQRGGSSRPKHVQDRRGCARSARAATTEPPRAGRSAATSAVTRSWSQATASAPPTIVRVAPKLGEGHAAPRPGRTISRPSASLPTSARIGARGGSEDPRWSRTTSRRGSAASSGPSRRWSGSSRRSAWPSYARTWTGAGVRSAGPVPRPPPARGLPVAHPARSVPACRGSPLARGAGGPVRRHVPARRPRPALARRGTPYLSAAHGFEYWLSIAPGPHAMMRRATAPASRVPVMCSAFIARVGAHRGPRPRPRVGDVSGADTDTFHPDLPVEDLRERHGLADRPLVVCVSRLVPQGARTS